MTDQIPADVHPEDMAHARAYVQDVLDATYAPDRILAVARVLQTLLPTPPRPTLADMTYEERKECQWMQAESKPTGSRVVILEPNWTVGHARVLRETGRAIEASADALTPRPDLPRMTWPTGEEGEPRND